MSKFAIESKSGDGATRDRSSGDGCHALVGFRDGSLGDGASGMSSCKAGGNVSRGSRGEGASMEGDLDSVIGLLATGQDGRHGDGANIGDCKGEAS
jgi:hypothetical protein